MTKAISPAPAIRVDGLHKSFGRTHALDGLDLHVGAGEVHGLLGPNGAGKSTTIRVLLGLLRADGGTARLLGKDPWQDAVELHRRIAYVPGDVTLWRNLSGGEVIDLYGRLRGEETAERAEPVLAGAVGRLRWAGSHLVLAYLGTAVTLASGGLGLGLAYGLSADDLGGKTAPVLAAALSQVPAVWTLTGLAVLVLGLLPKATGAVWALVGGCLAIGWVGPSLKFPRWAMNLSPYGHLPKLPGTDATAAPFVWLLALSALLALAGLAGLRRRDIG
ncbi:ATP-binding cassette domain-containing protein [Streptomyces sp. MS1.AVA.3]|uniref:ATP-binding cassette domain-containing protein n=1 Tax=Streptomyces decoyicus TaxID=249567 RepID=UPI0030C0A68A